MAAMSGGSTGQRADARRSSPWRHRHRSSHRRPMLSGASAPRARREPTASNRDRPPPPRTASYSIDLPKRTFCAFFGQNCNPQLRQRRRTLISGEQERRGTAPHHPACRQGASEDAQGQNGADIVMTRSAPVSEPR